MATENVPAWQPGELHIEFWPLGYDQWIGTRAQLEAEGLIQTAFEWPQGRRDRFWESGGFKYWLARTRPNEFKGPQKAWLEIDHFRLRRMRPLHDGFAAARLHEKREALAWELWRRTPAADKQWRLYWRAHEDERFQAFKALFMPQPKKRGRLRKTADVSHSNDPR